MTDRGRPMRRRPALLLAAALAAGCADDGSEPVAGVDLQPVNFAGLDAAVREHKGSVVVVDFWATTCPPCRERFPELMEMRRKYAEHGLAVVTVSMDEPDDEKIALRFLRKHRATCTNYRWAETTRDGVRAMNQRFKYRGFIPHVAVFGRDGGLAWASGEEPLSPTAFDKLVRTELEKN